MTKATIESWLGPRVPARERREHRARYAMPSILLAAAAVLLLISLFQPFWKMTLHAPQYPRGLTVHAYLNRLEGDVHEIDGLNHYIGMRRLDEAARLERELSAMAVTVVALLVLGAIFIHDRRAAWLALPAALFPVGFLVDMYLWLSAFGNNLDPHAALSSSVKPFTPPVLGTGLVGQFRTVALPEAGLLLAGAASLLIGAGLWLHRRAYKPLVEKARGAAVVAALLLLAGAGAGARAAAPFDLAAALRDASAGTTIRVPAGIHGGTFVVDKRLVLEGEAGAILEGRGDGDVLRITAPGVVVRNLAIRRTGASLDRENAGILVLAPDVTIERVRLSDVLFGIYARKADRVVVRDCTVTGKDFDVTRRGDSIRLWSCNDGRVEGNHLRHTRDLVVWFSQRTFVTGNDVRDSRYGLHLMYASDTVMEDNALGDGSVGAFLMYSDRSVFRRNVVTGNRGPSGYGLGLKDNDDLIAEDNDLVGNRVGIYLDNSPNRIDSHGVIRGNRIAYNDVGLAFLPAVRRNEISGNTFQDNLEQVAVLGPGTFAGNAFTVGGRGNFWSDYRGFDLDGDGLGDLPYRSESLFETLIDRHPELRLFRYSAAEDAVDLATRAFPVIKPRTKLEDVAPLMTAAEPRTRTSGTTPAPFAAASAALLLAFASTATWARSGRRPPIATLPSRPVLALAPSARRAMVRLARVTKRFGRHRAVDGISFEIASGEAVALWGPNGAGKSTLLKCLLGLLRFEGEIRIDGHDAVRDAKAARRCLGYVPQELAFYPEWTGRDLLDFIARLRRAPVEQVERCLARVGLAAHASKPIGALSGGMKQRLALAAALLGDPPLLVLDEITSNLDAAGREGLLRILAELKRSGKTIVFTTHRREDVLRLADRVVLLAGGVVTAQGSASIVPDAEASGLEELS